jgi:hypothetical protein
MSNSNPENNNITIARNLSEKYEFYLLALVFTVLAFTVQTADMVNRYYQYCFEIGAWVLFAVSGLVGLSRLEWLPIAYKQCGLSQEEKDNISKFVHGLAGGNLVNKDGEEWQEADMARAKNDLELQNKAREKKIETLEKISIIKFYVHKWSFLLGLVILIVSRAISHLVKVGVIS